MTERNATYEKRKGYDVKDIVGKKKD